MLLVILFINYLFSNGNRKYIQFSIQLYKFDMIPYHTIYIRMVLYIQLFNPNIIVQHITKFFFVLTRIKEPKSELRFFSLMTVIVSLCFQCHWESCYHHNTNFHNCMSIYKIYILSYYCDNEYLYDVGHYQVGLKNIYLATEFRYGLSCLDF